MVAQNINSIKEINKRNYQIDKGSVSVNLHSDVVAVEEPLQINLLYFEQTLQSYQSRQLGLTMRTPGQDQLLIIGLLYTEGIIQKPADILSIKVIDQDEQNNQVDIKLSADIELDWQKLERQLIHTSSCGVCGKGLLKALELKQSSGQTQPKSELIYSSAFIISLPDLLKQQQVLFKETGGVHGAGFYHKNELTVQEDIGRHNALDKLIGQLFNQQLDMSEGVLVLSGRISFDLMQKAVAANIKVIIAVGAPSSLAIAVAKQFNITLVGFIKDKRFNVYHGHWRINSELEADDVL